MSAHTQPGDPRRATGLTNRRRERGVLDQLLEAVRAGESRVLVMRGDPGVGKTVLLDYLAGRAYEGCRIARAAGVQSEMELAFAGLHQLCAPMLEHLEAIPGAAARGAADRVGLAAGPPPDRFLVGLAVLSLLVGGGRGSAPLVCVVDDEQSARLRFGADAGVRRPAAGRRSGRAACSPARDPSQELAGLPGA